MFKNSIGKVAMPRSPEVRPEKEIASDVTKDAASLVPWKKNWCVISHQSTAECCFPGAEHEIALKVKPIG